MTDATTQAAPEPNAATAAKAPAIRPRPEIRRIGVDDITASLREGAEDFRAMPAFGMTIGAAYALGGALILFAVWAIKLYPLAFPLLAGFALVGPFAGMALYEGSRRRDRGETVTVSDIAKVVPATARSGVLYLGFILLFLLFFWAETAAILTMTFFGSARLSMAQILSEVFTTLPGFAFMIFGNVIGAAISLVVFAVSVVSFPYMLETDADPVTAVALSVSAVAQNVMPLLGWAVFIGVALVVSWLPMFLGLLITLPVIGHASWRLYKRMIVLPEEAVAEDAPASA